MNNEPTQRTIELEIMELEDKLAYKKDQLKRFKLLNESGKYFLDSGGEIRELVPMVNDSTWRNAIKQGNTFKTKKDAEKERDRRELLYEFNEFRDECNNGWSPNWEDDNERKHFIILQQGKLWAISDFLSNKFATFGYFQQKEHCLEVIEKFGDRIKKLYID